jgi:hypothetical protein
MADLKRNKFNYSENKSCVKCGEQISDRATICLACLNNGSNNIFYIDGRSLKEHYCIDGCGRRIHYDTWRKGKKRCRICSNSGVNNPMYIDGKSFDSYSPKFTKTLKDQIRQRDGFKCQNCGELQTSHLLKSGQKLSVHHIDYDKQNCRKNNLISLCHSCHSITNKNRKDWENLYTNKMEILYGTV